MVRMDPSQHNLYDARSTNCPPREREREQTNQQPHRALVITLSCSLAMVECTRTFARVCVVVDYTVDDSLYEECTIIPTDISGHYQHPSPPARARALHQMHDCRSARKRASRNVRDTFRVCLCVSRDLSYTLPPPFHTYQQQQQQGNTHNNKKTRMIITSQSQCTAHMSATQKRLKNPARRSVRSLRWHVILIWCARVRRSALGAFPSV